MYIATVLNTPGLFQRLGGWRKTAALPIQNNLDEFLYRATASYLHLTRMRALADMCLRHFEQHKPALTLAGDRVALWSPIVVELLNEFSPYLATLRIMQNLILPLVGSQLGLRLSIPGSMAEAVKRIRTYGFPLAVTRAVDDYWHSGGADVKGYRDIDQHFTAIVRHAFLQLSPTEAFVVLLPDDPTERSAARFRFDKRRDAVPYFGECYAKLHNLVDGLAEVIGFPEHPIEQAMDMAAIGDLVEGETRTLGLLIEDSAASSALEIGQTPERKIYLRRLPAPSVT